MADTAEYEVTERAGKKVAGRVVVAGQSLVLTEAEAEHALLDGTIVPKGKKLSKAYAEDSKALTRMRDEAQAVRARAPLPPASAAPAAPAADPAPAA